MFAVVYRRTKRAFYFHARYSIKCLISRHIRSRSLTRQFYGPNFAGFLAQIFARMSGRYKCVVPFSFISRSVFIAPVRLIIVTFCLAH